MPKLQYASNELHFELVHTIAQGGIGMLQRAQQMGAGHFSKRSTINLIRQSILTARKVILNDKDYRPTNAKLAIYIKGLFGNNSSSAAKRWALSETPGLEQNEET